MIMIGKSIDKVKYGLMVRIMISFQKFRSYTLSNNRIARLQSKFNAIQKALGEDNVSATGVRIR